MNDMKITVNSKKLLHICNSKHTLILRISVQNHHYSSHTLEVVKSVRVCSNCVEALRPWWRRQFGWYILQWKDHPKPKNINYTNVFMKRHQAFENNRFHWPTLIFSLHRGHLVMYLTVDSILYKISISLDDCKYRNYTASSQYYLI